MKIIFYSLSWCVFSLFIAGQINAQVKNFQPLDLAKKIMQVDPFEEIEEYIIGEYTGKPNGQSLKPNTQRRFLLLQQDNKTAVVNISLTDTNGQTFDTYMHFSKHNVWKATAFRALAMTGFIAQLHEKLSSLNEAQIDSLIKIASVDSNKSVFSSRAEFDFERGNTGLTIASDSALIEHFTSNKETFEWLKVRAQETIRKLKDKQEVESVLNVGEGLEQKYKKILLSSIHYGGYEFGNVLDFLIGGMIDNTVGYLYIEDPADIPEMSPSRIIMLRKITEGWYLYKTT